MGFRIENGKYYKFLTYAVALVLINLVAVNFFFRVDLTQNDLYSLSRASKEVVSTLKEPLTINVFFSKNIPAPYNNVEQYLHDLLEEYSIYANDRFNYRFYNVSSEEGDLSPRAKENRELAQSYGIYPVNIQTIENDQAKVQRAYMGMVLIHGNVVENLNSLTSTEGLEYKITTAIRKMNNKISALLNLDGDIRVTLYRSSSLNDLLDYVEIKGLTELDEGLDQVVTDLNRENYSRLKLQKVDPSREALSEEEGAPFQRFKLQWDELRTPGGGVIPAGEGFVALQVRYRDRKFEKNLLTQNMALTERGLTEQFQVIDKEKVEEFISSNIDNLIQVNDDIGYVSSSGTLSLMPALPPQFARMQQQESELKVFDEVVSENYTIKQIDLAREEIPEGIDTLIIAGPTEEFSDWELFQIDQFLMKGKSLAVFMDPFKEIQQNQRNMMNRGFQQPVYLPLNTGLEKLLNSYGLTVKRSYVMDKNCFVNQDPRTGEMPIYYAPKILEKNINHDFDFLKDLKQLVLIKCAPLAVEEETIQKHDIQASRLVLTSDKAWEMSGRINLMPMFIQPPQAEEEYRQFPLALLWEGSAESYFKDREIPQKPRPEEEKTDEEEGEDAAPAEKPEVIAATGLKTPSPLIEQGRSGKIFLIGSTEFLKNNVLVSPDFANSVFLINMLDYLNNKEDLAVLRAKKQRFNPIRNTSLFARRVAQYVNVAGLPLLVIVIGFAVWARRTNRKRMIRNKFNSRG